MARDIRDALQEAAAKPGRVPNVDVLWRRGRRRRVRQRAATAAVAVAVLVAAVGGVVAVAGDSPSPPVVEPAPSPPDVSSTDRSTSVNCGSGEGASVVVDRRAQEGWIVRTGEIRGEPCVAIDFVEEGGGVESSGPPPAGGDWLESDDLLVEQIGAMKHAEGPWSYVYGFTGQDVTAVAVEFDNGSTSGGGSTYVLETYSLQLHGSERVFVARAPEPDASWTRAEALDAEGTTLNVVSNPDAQPSQEVVLAPICDEVEPIGPNEGAPEAVPSPDSEPFEFNVPELIKQIEQYAATVPGAYAGVWLEWSTWHDTGQPVLRAAFTGDPAIHRDGLDQQLGVEADHVKIVQARYGLSELGEIEDELARIDPAEQDPAISGFGVSYPLNRVSVTTPDLTRDFRTWLAQRFGAQRVCAEEGQIVLYPAITPPGQPAQSPR